MTTVSLRPEGLDRTAASADESPIVIGVTDAEPVRFELEKLTSGRRINNHPIETRRVSEGWLPTQGKRHGPETCFLAAISWGKLRA